MENSWQKKVREKTEWEENTREKAEENIEFGDRREEL